MRTFIVQFRPIYCTRLVSLGAFRARTHLGAIVQAAAILRGRGEDTAELIATEEK